MNSPNVNLNIEELILHGFAHRDRHRIGEVLERELSRLIVEGGLPSSHTALDARDEANTIRVAANARPEVVGEQIAQAVYRGLARESVSQFTGNERTLASDQEVS